MSTVFAKSESVRGDWFVVDASDKILGRLATQIAMRLKGKHKAIFSPHVDMGDHIVVLNAEKIKVTGNKLDDKIYYHHTGRKMYKKLHVFAGDKHPHAAQQPKSLEI
jgi:large subunit ribosomal protein L13